MRDEAIPVRRAAKWDVCCEPPANTDPILAMKSLLLSTASQSMLQLHGAGKWHELYEALVKRMSSRVADEESRLDRASSTLGADDFLRLIFDAVRH